MAWFIEGRVCAGFPSAAEDLGAQRIDLTKELVKHPQATHLIRAKGQSMTGDGIFDDDILLVDKAIQARHNHIHRAQAEVARGLNIDCPVLVMHAKRSAWLKQWSDEALVTDIVLDVADIERLSPELGRQVGVRSVEDGIHDLVLSKPPVRKKIFQELFDWLNSVSQFPRQPSSL